MKKIFLLLMTSALSFISFSEDTVKVEKPWHLKAIYALNGTQTSFVNWNAGGRNNIALLAGITANAYFKKGHISWMNDLGIALGGLQYIEKGNKEGLQKTDDRLDLSSVLGYKMKEHFYFSFIGGLKTQMLDGFAFPNDSVRVSTFMAPGYINMALGLDYIKSDNFSIFTSPIAAKLTVVNDELLSNAGAFGVEPAQYDALGNVLVPGKRLRSEFGAYVKMKYNANLAKNIDMRSKLEFFSNYMDDPQNIDVNAELIMNFKVNSWFSASLQWTLIYDDDVDIRDADGNIGPRTQFKSVLGLGISYKMENIEKTEPVP